MIKKGCIIISAALCIFVSNVHAVCDLEPAYSISETAPNGTLIFNGTKTQGHTVTFQVKNPNATKNPQGFMSDIKSALRLTNNDTTFKLQNTQQLDLEKFWISYEVDITTITLTVTCDGNTNDVFISVTPVNEFTPVFVNSPYNITLPESTRVGTVVYKLKSKVKDEDVGGVQNFYFQIHPYSIADYDGSAFFSIPASSTGNITLTKPLDFDTTAKNTRSLNLSVADGQSADAKTARTTLQVNIEDVDDQVPYFEYPNCPAPCPAPAFVSVTRLLYTGSLEITPPLKGKDDDTLGTALLYSIKSGNKNNLFTMDASTGAVTQAKSVDAANLPDSEFRLVIEVRKDLQNIDLSSIAILTVKVWERLRNDTGYPKPPVGRSTEEKDGSSLLIPLIVLGVLLTIVIVALIVVFVIYRKKQREMAVGPAEDKSEPQTEEEDLHTEGEDYTGRADSDERLVFGNKATLGIMTDDFPSTAGGRANQLPPLPMRDTATETTEGKRKKKSRKRNKNKEPEIFDGTREYNMGADPEFFDSTDKSRVKRSQRSKKADPSLPIQVPNDNAADIDSVYM
ncbi:protocadherin-10-like [Mercenaria mercenaria]|uniref:protocadherin-10-like n=1 Tax=Mercenaria mercenaria TaxID=6596 RepID=UPI00234EE0B0|nr:protocadherin-10-like [Mercenaria mercenaria]